MINSLRRERRASAIKANMVFTVDSRASMSGFSVSMTVFAGMRSIAKNPNPIEQWDR